MKGERKAGNQQGRKKVQRGKEKRKEGNKQQRKKKQREREGRERGNSEHGVCIFTVTTRNISQTFQS